MSSSSGITAGTTTVKATLGIGDTSTFFGSGGASLGGVGTGGGVGMDGGVDILGMQAEVTISVKIRANKLSHLFTFHASLRTASGYVKELTFPLYFADILVYSLPQSLSSMLKPRFSELP